MARATSPRRRRERASARVVLHLVAAELADREVARLRVRKIEARNRGGGQHGEGFREAHAGVLLCVEQAEERAFRAVVGTRRIARRGPDAAVALGDELGLLEALVARVAPLAPHALVQPLGKRFREAIGQHLQHDRAVVVAAPLELGDARLDATGADRERAEPVANAARLRRDEVRKTEVGTPLRLVVLLAQVVPRHQRRVALLVGIDLNVVGVDLRRRIEAEDTVCLDEILANDAR